MCWRERGGPETGRRGGAIPPFGESSHPLSTTARMVRKEGFVGAGEQAAREEINPAAGIVNSDSSIRYGVPSDSTRAGRGSVHPSSWGRLHYGPGGP